MAQIASRQTPEPLLLRRGLRTLLFVGFVIRLQLSALLRRQNLFDPFVRLFPNFFHLGVLLVLGKSRVGLHRVQLGLHVFVDLLHLGFLIVAQIQVRKIVAVPLSTLRGLLPGV